MAERLGVTKSLNFRFSGAIRHIEICLPWIFWLILAVVLLSISRPSLRFSSVIQVINLPLKRWPYCSSLWWLVNSGRQLFEPNSPNCKRFLPLLTNPLDTSWLLSSNKLVIGFNGRFLCFNHVFPRNGAVLQGNLSLEVFRKKHFCCEMRNLSKQKIPDN